MPPSSLSVPVGHTPATGCSHRSLFVNPSRPLFSRRSPSCRLSSVPACSLLSLSSVVSPSSLCSRLFSFVYSLCSRRSPSSLRLLPLFPLASVYSLCSRSVFVRPPSTPSVRVYLLSLFLFY
ncbi:hypothetical protein ACFE04_031013 [Oxalis oulophora]